MADWFTEKGTIGELPARAADRFGEREALCFGERRWTFGAFADEVDRAARALIALGVAPGDRVALWMMNRPEWLFLFYAVAKVGAVSVPLNTRLRADDIRFVLAHSNAATLVQSDRSGPVDFVALTREVLPGLGAAGRGEPGDAAFPDLRRVVTVGADPDADALWWPDCLERADEVDAAALAARASAVDPEATAIVVYTSGTTGFPKGVMHSHRPIRASVDRASRLGVTASDVFLCFLPLFHVYGLSEFGLMFLLTGSRLVLTEAYDPEESVRLIERERATMVHGFDVHFDGLLQARERLGADVSSLRVASIPSGMDSTLPVARRALAELCPIVSAYGLTEGWCCAAIGFLDGSEEQRVETSGYPMPGYEFRIVDPDTGRDVPEGTVGEIALRGYMVMQGYYREPEATAAAVDADGWLSTGDVGVLRPDGYLRFLGRFKDVLKVGGENVSPSEVEGYLLERHPLELAAVVGYPDERLGEVPVAFVVPRPDCALDAEALEAAVVASCRGRLAGFKVPRRVIVLDAMPITASGKIQEHLLRDRALDLLGPAEPTPRPRTPSG